MLSLFDTDIKVLFVLRKRERKQKTPRSRGKVYGSVGEIPSVRHREFNVRVVFDVHSNIFLYMLLFLCNL